VALTIQSREATVATAMLLFKKQFHEGLVNGATTLTFRRWDKPRVKVGGRYRCHPIGVLVVDGIARVRVADLAADDATRAGFASLDELVAYLRTAPGAGPLRKTTELYRIELHHGGDGDRVAVALDDQLTPEDIALLRAKLARMDAPGPWTKKTLGLIAKNPRVAASRLAAKVGRETLPFKADVRKLKRLGLTQSFEVGYELSPRGVAYLAAGARRKRAGA
jgi:hypothetical protein